MVSARRFLPTTTTKVARNSWMTRTTNTKKVYPDDQKTHISPLATQLRNEMGDRWRGGKKEKLSPVPAISFPFFGARIAEGTIGQWSDRVLWIENATAKVEGRCGLRTMRPMTKCPVDCERCGQCRGCCGLRAIRTTSKCAVDCGRYGQGRSVLWFENATADVEVCCGLRTLWPMSRVLRIEDVSDNVEVRCGLQTLWPRSKCVVD